MPDSPILILPCMEGECNCKVGAIKFLKSDYHVLSSTRGKCICKSDYTILQDLYESHSMINLDRFDQLESVYRLCDIFNMAQLIGDSGFMYNCSGILLGFYIRDTKLNIMFSVDGRSIIFRQDIARSKDAMAIYPYLELYNNLYIPCLMRANSRRINWLGGNKICNGCIVGYTVDVGGNELVIKFMREMM